MTQWSVTDAFRGALDERFRELLDQLSKVVTAIASGVPNEQRMKAVRELNHVAKILVDSLSSKHRPEWLNQLYTVGHAYERHPDDGHARQYLETLLKNYRHVRQIEFAEDEPPIDFDSIYRQYRDKGNLAELFDELIRIVNAIIESGKVETLTALSALQKVIELLRASRNGSYLATKSSLSLARYLKHLADIALEKIPVLSDLREAYDRTLSEADVEMERVENQIRSETIKSLAEQVPQFKKLPDFGSEFVSIVEPLALPSPDAIDKPTAAE